MTLPKHHYQPRDGRGAAIEDGLSALAETFGIVDGGAVDAPGKEGSGDRWWDEKPLPTPEPSARPGLINVPVLLLRLASHLEKDALEKNVCISTDIEPDALVFGDGNSLQEALAQVLRSAFEKTPHGGRLAVTGGVANSITTIQIASEWPQPEPDVLPHSWRGYRAGCRRVLRGFGFLPGFVGHTLREHSAQMEVQHRAGEGSRFIIRIPLLVNLRCYPV